MRRILLAPWALFALLACSPSGNDLVVSVRSDLVPGVEFDGVETAVFAGESASGSPLVYERAAMRGERFLEGQTVAQYSELLSGSYVARVRLVSAGRVVLTRNVRFDLRDALGVTLLMTRDCLDVVCPADGDAPELTECVGGRCADPACTVETPEACGAPPCASDADCAPAAACAAGACVSGTCLVVPDDGACGPGQRCDPAVGCATPQCDTDGDCGPVDACATAVCAGGSCVVVPYDSRCPFGQSCDPTEGCRGPAGSGCDVCGTDGTCATECVGDCTCPVGCNCEVACMGACNVTCFAGSECRVTAPIANVTCDRASCYVDAAEGTFTCGMGSTCGAICTGSTLTFDCVNADCCWEGMGCSGRNCVGGGSCGGTTSDGTATRHCSAGPVSCPTPDPGCIPP